MYDKISKNVTTFAKNIDTLKNMMGLQYTGGSEILRKLKRKPLVHLWEKII